VFADACARGRHREVTARTCEATRRLERRATGAARTARVTAAMTAWVRAAARDELGTSGVSHAAIQEKQVEILADPNSTNAQVFVSCSRRLGQARVADAVDRERLSMNLGISIDLDRSDFRFFGFVSTGGRRKRKRTLAEVFRITS